MKQKKIDLTLENKKLKQDNDVLSLAVADLCNGSVKWFGDSIVYSVGISRPHGAAGGIAIVRCGGMVSAYYFEQFAADRLAAIGSMIGGECRDVNHYAELVRRRDTILDAQAYITLEQNRI